MGTGYWSPRPLLIALALFAVLIVMVENDTGPPWAVVPLMWVWVNVHGSWPFALAYLVLRLGGPARRRHALGRLPRLLGLAVLGAVLGALNPIGPRLLAYPLTVLTHHQAFSHIAEWQSPSFSDPVNVVFLAEVLLAVILLVARRGTIEDALVVTVFTGAALVASRNVPVAALVVTPVLARGLAGLGTIDGTGRGVVAGAALVALAALGVALVGGALQHPAYNLSTYPVTEVTWMQDHGLVPGRVAAPDYVGNYLEWRYGTRANVFIDDRVDIFPDAVNRDYDVLLDGAQGWQTVLARYGFHAVLWPRSEPLASLVAEDPDWSVRLLGPPLDRGRARPPGRPRGASSPTPAEVGRRCPGAGTIPRSRANSGSRQASCRAARPPRAARIRGKMSSPSQDREWKSRYVSGL